MFVILYTFCSGGSLVAYSDSNKKEEEQKQKKKKKKVVVLGTGWAGISFLKDLDISSYDVQVVSPQNYFAFTPLLPSVTCGTVEARSIVESVRNITKKVCLNLLVYHHSAKLTEFFKKIGRKMERLNYGKQIVSRSILPTTRFAANQFSRTIPKQAKSSHSTTTTWS